MIGRKVLLIDNDAESIDLLSGSFMEKGAQVIIAQDSLDGISKTFTYKPDLIILDITDRETYGVQVCRVLREFTNVPIIMTSALDQDHLMMQGLEAGADDFLVKPFHTKILLASARRVIRRYESNLSHTGAFCYDDGCLRIDVERHLVSINNKRVKLTPVELRLLVYLAGNAGRVLSFEQILENVWGDIHTGNRSYVHVYVSHLRNKIEEDPKSPLYIRSIHGEGYIFEQQVKQQSFSNPNRNLAAG